MTTLYATAQRRRIWRVSFAAVNAANIGMRAWDHNVAWLVFSCVLFAYFAALLMFEAP